jgi:hypothetical protein
VQHERVHVGAKLGHEERHPLHHQPCDEVHVAAQPVELGYQHRATVASRCRQRRRELGSAIEGVRFFPGLDFGERFVQLHAISGGELGATLSLGIQS